MKSNVKKIWAIIATSLLATSSMAHAAYGDSNQQKQQAKQPNQKSAANGKSNERVINPAARPILNNALDFWIDGELLWWKARESGLDYATKVHSREFIVTPGTPTPGTTPFSEAGLITHSGDVKNPHFHWEFGVRAGLGFNLPFDGWDISLAWTHLNSHAHRNGTSADPIYGDRIIPKFQPVAVPDQFYTSTFAKPDWRLHFNTIDLDLGREFFVSRHLTLRPFIGVRAAWVHQRYDVYTNLFTGQGQNGIIIPNPATGATVAVDTVSVNSKVHMKSNFNGLGPRVGFDTEWRLGAGFSIYGQAAASLLLGHFEVDYTANLSTKVTNVATGVASPVLTEPSALHNSFHDARATADLAIGIRWAKRFMDDSYRVRIDLGWEEHIFFSQNQFISITNTLNPVSQTAGGNVPDTSSVTSDTSRKGDLTLSGLTFAIRFDF